MIANQFLVNTRRFRAFVDTVEAIIDATPDSGDVIDRLREPFRDLLRDDSWLPEEFAVPAIASGMGGGIGSYLLYRRLDHSLSISSLVVPAGAATPIHDHLAWGLVGLYRGEQFEEVFAREATEIEDRADLRLVDRRHLRRGDFYELMPPRDDIHRVVAANTRPSVSIHLLRNDVGCIHRHRFVLEENRVEPFRSGYVNQSCDEDQR
ncbi:MAG: hypothetical protein EPO26_11310 [Chloroflexota bacterium]|nr:MAG: hypothetical protein EPO26_11310 [Chloroflexota bacterium]